jgi:hypothetical protein
MTSITEAAETGFAGADLEALRAYATSVGLEFTKSHNATTLRKMLTEAMAEGSSHYGEIMAEDEEGLAEEKRLKAMGLAKLNLRSQAGWTGRRHVVQLHRAMQHESTRPQFFAWGRLHCYVPMGVPVAIPYPIWEILKLTAGTRLVRKRRTDDEGRVYFEDSWVPNQRFMYSDMGPDPETAHLPKDMLDMITQLHEATNGFKGYTVRQLRELCSRVNITVEKDWEEIDLHAALDAKCGKSSGRVDIGAPDISQAATG